MITGGTEVGDMLEWAQRMVTLCAHTRIVTLCTHMAGPTGGVNAKPMGHENKQREFTFKVYVIALSALIITAVKTIVICRM